jgi:ankyrin repeat protein
LDVNQKGKNGRTPLQFSVVFDNKHAFSKLINHPFINLNSTCDEGDTALHLSARFNRTAMTSSLIDNGARICPKNKKGETPLELSGFFD